MPYAPRPVAPFCVVPDPAHLRVPAHLPSPDDRFVPSFRPSPSPYDPTPSRTPPPTSAAEGQGRTFLRSPRRSTPFQASFHRSKELSRLEFFPASSVCRTPSLNRDGVEWGSARICWWARALSRSLVLYSTLFRSLLCLENRARIFLCGSTCCSSSSQLGFCLLCLVQCYSNLLVHAMVRTLRELDLSVRVFVRWITAADSSLSAENRRISCTLTPYLSPPLHARDVNGISFVASAIDRWEFANSFGCPLVGRSRKYKWPLQLNLSVKFLMC